VRDDTYRQVAIVDQTKGQGPGDVLTQQQQQQQQTTKQLTTKQSRSLKGSKSARSQRRAVQRGPQVGRRCS
jgi:hypothetical protein